ncbi:MAG: hypothetical protein ACPG19_11770 [Saprospiraceae bacterium]
MKRILILAFVLVSFYAIGQDSSSVFYKNQIGIDILPLTVGIAADNQSPFTRISFTYRRAFSPKYYGTFRLEMNKEYRGNNTVEYRGDSLSLRKSSIISILLANSYNELSFTFSRKFSYKKVKLHAGILVSAARMNGIELTREQTDTIFPYQSETIYSDNRKFFRVSCGLELGIEVPITQRWQMLFNFYSRYNTHLGSWKHIGRDGMLQDSSIHNSEFFNFLKLNSIMVLYQF